MSLNILKSARENLSVLRRTGSTTAIKNLYSNLPAFVLVVHNDMYAREIKRSMRGYKGRMTTLSMSAGQPVNLRGIHDPIAVDTSALLHVIDIGIQDIENSERTIESLKNIIHIHDNIISRIGQALLSFWPRHYDEKRWNKYGWDYDHVDEANRIADLACKAIRNNGRIYSRTMTRVNAIRFGRLKKNNLTTYIRK